MNSSDDSDWDKESMISQNTQQSGLSMQYRDDAQDGVGYVAPAPSPSKPVNAEDDDAASRAVHLHVTPLLFVASLLCFIDRSNLSFASLSMNEELSFTPLVYSTGASMFFLSYLILHVPASLLAHRIGARKGLSLMLAAWGIVSSCMAFVWSPAVFYSVRVCLGAAESGFYPAVTLYLTLWHASSAMGVNFAIITASTTLAGVIGGPLAIALMSAMDGVLGWAGWRWMYVLEAIPAVIVLLLVFLPDGPHDHRRSPWLTPPLRRAVLSRIARAVTASGEIRPGGVQGGVLGTRRLCTALITRPRVCMMCLNWLLWGAAQNGVIYWMPLCLKSLDGMTATKIGLLSALIYFVAMVGMGVFARLSDSSGKHAHYLAASMLVSCLGFCGLAVSLKLFPHEAVVVCCFCVVAFGLWGVMGPFWALAPLQFSRAEAPIGIPLVNSMGVAGSFAGPLVVAALVGNTNSFVIAFAVSAGLSAASALAAVALMCMPSSFQRIPDSV